MFPDLQQILDNNTNADTGACPTGPIAPPVPHAGQRVLRGVPPDARLRRLRGTSTRARSRCTSASPRATASGGTNSADTTLLLASGTGPFLVTAPNTAVTWTARLDADGHVGRRGHERRADQHGEREDLAVDRRRPHVPVRARRRARRTTAREDVTRPEHRHDAAPASRSRRSGTSSSTSRTPTSPSRCRA